MGTRVGKRWRATFLEEIAKGAGAITACRIAGVSKQTVYTERENNAEFAQAWEEAKSLSHDALVAEARRRAVEGTLEAVWYKGEKVGDVRKYSDALLTELLRKQVPEFRDRVEVTGAGGGAVNHEVRVKLEGLSDDAIRALADVDNLLKRPQGGETDSLPEVSE